MKQAQFDRLKPGDVVRVKSSQKLYTYCGYCGGARPLFKQLRDGKPYGPSRKLAPASIDLAQTTVGDLAIGFE